MFSTLRIGRIGLNFGPVAPFAPAIRGTTAETRPTPAQAIERPDRVIRFAFRCGRQKMRARGPRYGRLHVSRLQVQGEKDDVANHEDHARKIQQGAGFLDGQGA
jgi:hypothetical protein